jgi:hypothetical protein
MRNIGEIVVIETRDWSSRLLLYVTVKNEN